MYSKALFIKVSTLCILCEVWKSEYTFARFFACVSRFYYYRIDSEVFVKGYLQKVNILTSMSQSFFLCI